MATKKAPKTKAKTKTGMTKKTVAGPGAKTAAGKKKAGKGAAGKKTARKTGAGPGAKKAAGKKNAAARKTSAKKTAARPTPKAGTAKSGRSGQTMSGTKGASSSAKARTTKFDSRSSSGRAPVTMTALVAFLKVNPLDDRLLVLKEGHSDRTPGGLIIPATASDRPQEGRVLAIGRGHMNKKGRVQAMDVKPGDTVLYSPYAGTEVQLNGQDVLILRESEVLGIRNTAN